MPWNKGPNFGGVLGMAEGSAHLVALVWAVVGFFHAFGVPRWVAWSVAIYAEVVPWIAEPIGRRITAQDGDRRDLVILLIAFSPLAASTLAALALRWFRS